MLQVAENLHLRTLVRQLQSQLSPTAVAAASAAAASGSSPAIRPPRPNTLPSPLRASSNPAANTGGEQALASVACNLNSLLVAPEKAPRKQEQAQKDKPKRFRLLRWTLGTGLRVAKLSASALGLYVASLLVAEKIHPAQLAPGKQIIDQVKKVTAKPVKVVQRVVRQAARARHLSAAGSSLVDVQNTSVLTSAPEQSTAADHDVLLAPETGCCTC